MGEDDKLAYNPIEKYLKCSELQHQGFSIKDIADFMGEQTGKVKQYLSILKLMDDYLDTYGYQGIYTRLERTEGPFVDLDRYLEAYKNNKTKAANAVKWSYDDSDISDLKQVCFDYIRSRYEDKEFREIARPGTDGCIFTYKELWKSFLEEHRTQVPKDKSTTDELRKLHPEEPVNQLLRNRDLEWAAAAKGPLEGNLGKYRSRLEDKRDANQPLKLLERALDALNAVDCGQEVFYTDPHVSQCVKEINTIIWDMKKSLDRKKEHVCQE
ncbi:MAG: hypothetical protein ACYDHF_01400 [Candidatus Cryosericum sp.]